MLWNGRRQSANVGDRRGARGMSGREAYTTGDVNAGDTFSCGAL